MSDERFENTNSSRGMSDTDKGYYEDLYNDLPKEVVDILMQTHPLMGKMTTWKQQHTVRAALREEKMWKKSEKQECSR